MFLLERLARILQLYQSDHEAQANAQWALAQVKITRIQIVNTIRESPTAVRACYWSIAEIKEELPWDERHNLICEALVGREVQLHALIRVEDHPHDSEMQ